MSEKARYFKIGLFTLFSIVLLCAGLVLFGAGSVFQAPPLIVETYFKGSVQGLDVGALVKMNGVKIGKVKDILFVKDVYGKGKSVEDLSKIYDFVCVRFELESRFFPGLKGKSHQEIQGAIDYLVNKNTFRARLEAIGITGLVYVELGFYDSSETLPPPKISWTPAELYIPSSEGVAMRLGESLNKFLNKLDTDVYPMLENINRASSGFPALTAQLNETLPHIKTISKNIDDITSTGKKYPSQMIFGDAPPKSRFDR